MDVAHCTLDGNADAVEFCPHSSFSNVLAASTYTLQEGDQPSRSGSLSIFNVNADIRSLELLHRVETAGIFDIKWSPVGQTASPLLAQADADGCLRIHALECSSNGVEGIEMGSFFLSHFLEKCVGMEMLNVLGYICYVRSTQAQYTDDRRISLHLFIP